MHFVTSPYTFGFYSGKGIDEASSTDESKKIKSGFFDANKKSETTGCLVVNGDKEQYKGTGTDGDKGKGNFRFLWSLKQSESKGFVVFAIAEDSNDKKLWWRGVAYAVENKDEIGKITRKRAVVTTSGQEKKFDQNSVENNFPKMKREGNKFPFGGFVSGKEDLAKICGDSDCKTGTPQVMSFNGYGTGKGEKNGSEERKVDTELIRHRILKQTLNHSSQK